MATPLLGALVGMYKSNTDKVLQWFVQHSKVPIATHDDNGHMRVNLEALVKAANDLRQRSITPGTDIKWSFEYALQLRDLVTSAHEKEELNRWGHCLTQTQDHKKFNKTFRGVYDLVCCIKAKDKRKAEKKNRGKPDDGELQYPVVYSALGKVQENGYTAQSSPGTQPAMSLSEDIELINFDRFTMEALTLDALIGRLKSFWEYASGNPESPSLMFLGYITRGGAIFANGWAGMSKSSKTGNPLYQRTLVGALRHIRVLTGTSGSRDSVYKPTLPNLLAHRYQNRRSEEGFEGIRREDFLPFMERCLERFLLEYRNDPLRISTQGVSRPLKEWFRRSADIAQNPTHAHDLQLLEEERITAVTEICWNVVQEVQRTSRDRPDTPAKVLADEMPLANVLHCVINSRVKKGVFQMEFSLNMGILLETTDSWLWSQPPVPHFKRDSEKAVQTFAREILSTIAMVDFKTIGTLSDKDTKQALARLVWAKDSATSCLTRPRNLLHSLPWTCASTLAVMHEAISLAGLSLCNVGSKVAAVMYMYAALRSCQLLESIWFLETLVIRLGPIVFGMDGMPTTDLYSAFCRLHGVPVGAQIQYGLKGAVSEDLFPWSRFPHLDYIFNKDFEEVLSNYILESGKDVLSPEEKKKFADGQGCITGFGYLEACYSMLWPNFDRNDLENSMWVKEEPGPPVRYTYLRPSSRADKLPSARLNLVKAYVISCTAIEAYGSMDPVTQMPEIAKHVAGEGLLGSAQTHGSMRKIELLLQEADSVLRSANAQETTPRNVSCSNQVLQTAAKVLVGQMGALSPNDIEWKFL